MSKQPTTLIQPGNPSSALSSEVAWSDQTLDNPHARDDKAQRVQAMFAAIARSYDLNNHLHSLWIDHLWRRAAVKAAAVQQGEKVLDLACGTGDLTHAFARHTQASQVLGIDFTPQMLDFARLKRDKLPEALASKIEYQTGDAMALDLPDASFDVVSIAFGLRNVQQPERAVAEFFRVLRPGGRVVVLEFDQPRLAPVRWFNKLYCEVIMPRTATLIARDRSGAYRYLPKSVAAFRTRAQVLGMLSDAGFIDGRAKGLTLDLCACYRAIKPR